MLWERRRRVMVALVILVLFTFVPQTILGIKAALDYPSAYLVFLWAHFLTLHFRRNGVPSNPENMSCIQPAPRAEILLGFCSTPHHSCMSHCPDDISDRL